eukprot:c25865_g1_i1 orf=582-1421(+)
MGSDDESRRMKNSWSCEWSPGAVSCLLDSYSEKYSLGRGYLRNKEWEEVMSDVNNRFGGTKSTKTMKQCRDKVDSLKRRYKAEKRKREAGVSAAVIWPFFKKLDEMIGSAMKANSMIQKEGIMDCVLTDDKLECSGSRDECAVDSIHCDALFRQSIEKGKKRQERIDGLSEDRSNSLSFSHGKSSSRAGTQELADDSSEHKIALQMQDVLEKQSTKKRRAKSGSPVQAIADAVIGFSEVFARIELAKMEIFSRMELEMAKLQRKRRKRRASTLSSSDTD